MTKSRDRDARLVSKLPSMTALSPKEGVPPFIQGSTILFMGCVEDGNGKASELVLDVRARTGKDKRIVIGFTELGMWVESISPRPSPIRDADSNAFRAELLDHK